MLGFLFGLTFGARALMSVIIFLGVVGIYMVFVTIGSIISFNRKEKK